LNMSLRSACCIDEVFFWWKSNLPVFELSDCQVFQIVGCWIKQILPYVTGVCRCFNVQSCCAVAWMPIKVLLLMYVLLRHLKWMFVYILSKGMCSCMNPHKGPVDNVYIVETFKMNVCIYFVKRDVSCYMVTSKVWEK
jgi:hypothetical protein